MDSDSNSYHSESEFYYPDEENPKKIRKKVARAPGLERSLYNSAWAAENEASEKDDV